MSLLVFLNKGFKFQPYICSKCHVLLLMPMNLSDIAILKIKSADYCCIISEISKSKAIKLLKNIDLTEKIETLYKKKMIIESNFEAGNLLQILT